MEILGSEIFKNIENDEYLHEIFEAVLTNYSYFLFRIQNREPKVFDLTHALRFADLLSKSVGSSNSEKHKIWAQELIALLAKLYPDKESVKYYMRSVLINVCNYRGLSLQPETYPSEITLEHIYENFEKDLLKIPASPDMFFFRSQKSVYDSFTANCFSYSGPTSMGKSFVMRMFIKDRMLKGYSENFVIVVPTKALINEVSSRIIDDINTKLAEYNYRVITSSGALSLQQEHNFVLVLTPERLLYLLLDKPEFKIDYLFVDEAHKISSKDSRSPFYYKVINILSQRQVKPHIIFSSPNIPNPEIYLQLIPEITITDANRLATTFSPVSQIKYLVDLVNQRVNIFNDYNNKFIDVGSFSQHVDTKRFIRSVGSKHQNIVYCSSTRQAVEMALEYTEDFSSSTENPELIALARDIKNEIHGDYYLAEVVQKGVAYHIGYLPSSIRLQIENLFRSGAIKTVFCTSTLVEGVNLPADNLFIMNYKNGISNMTPVEFRNLIGRVGRIEFNLYGNVFLISDQQRVKPEKYVELLEQEIPEQKLSIVSQLTEEQKRKVIECLKNGNVELLKYPKNQSADSYDLMRKFSIILLRDILTDNHNSIVRKEFETLLSSEEETQIIGIFSKRQQADDDINISIDQIENLQMAIADGLCYPVLNAQGNIDYNDLVCFLEKLCVIFKWEKYESTTLGHTSRKNGGHGKLRWYAVILSQWICGNGLNIIMNNAIEYKSKHPDSGVEINREYHKYDGSLKHRNIVISDTLDALEDVILFRIANYFLRFSSEYKRQHKQNIMENDWYEFVEYGTMNPLTIMLQRNGFSRETSTYIKQHREYLRMIDGNYRILKGICECSKLSVVKEACEVMYNIPELFIDD